MKRKIIASILVAMLLLSVTAMGATIRRTIEADYGISVKVSGEEAAFKDVAGNIVEPFTVNGTTYVPIRGVAEILGATVGYDAKDNAANIEVPYQTDVALDALTAMNCYKDLEDLAERAWELQDRVLVGVSYIGRIDKEKTDDYITKLSSDAIPSLDKDIREMELAIKGLRDTTDSDFMRDSLEAASSYLENLRIATGKTKNATAALALYSSTKTDKAYSDIMDYHEAADAVIDAVIDGAAEHYNSMYTSARTLVGEHIE